MIMEPRNELARCRYKEKPIRPVSRPTLNRPSKGTSMVTELREINWHDYRWIIIACVTRHVAFQIHMAGRDYVV
jgi:hypothetical protein